MEPFLIVGLGNIGTLYEGTRHNAGFIVLDELMQELNVSSPSVKFKGEVRSFQYKDFKGYTLKPHTFMNLSGESVKPLVDYYKIPIKNILVLHDDIDLNIGSMKFKKAGGDAGHNGLKSITANLNTNDYYRLRIGVGRPENASFDIKDWVLSKFNNDERNVLKDLSFRIKDCLSLFFEGNIARFQEKINTRK